MHFVENPRRNPIYLASFPGSGNTWLRFLLERGSRIYTGSVYPDDKSLQKQFPGELEKSSKVLCVKTHYPCPKCWNKFVKELKVDVPITSEDTGVLAGVDRTIFLLRSPFDSFYSEFQYVKTGSHSTALEPQDFVKIPVLLQKGYYNQTEYHNPSWDQFINHRLEAYLEGIKIHAKQDDTTRFVFYESLVKNMEHELRGVFDFLIRAYEQEGKRDTLWGTSKEMAACSVLYSKHDQVRFRRHRIVNNEKEKNEEEGVFNPWTRDQINRVCDALEPARGWFPQVWGNCRDGLLQVQREIRKK